MNLCQITELVKKKFLQDFTLNYPILHVNLSKIIIFYVKQFQNHTPVPKIV